MRVIDRLSGALLFVSVLLLIVGSGLLTGACGNNEAIGDTNVTSASSPSTVPTEAAATTASSGTTATTVDDTTTTAGVTTTGATTTKPAATTTTAKPITTTAQPTTTTAQPTTTTAQPTTTTAKAPTVLRVSGPSGVRELSMADLKALPSTLGYGGWKNELNNITAPTSWKGVSLTILMELVGGGSSVTVIASDGYAVTITAAEAEGTVSTYDPATGEPVGSISVKAIVAYAKGGNALGSGEGPLRIAFISSESNQVTDSDMWVKYVVELKVN